MLVSESFHIANIKVTVTGGVEPETACQNTEMRIIIHDQNGYTIQFIASGQFVEQLQRTYKLVFSATRAILDQTRGSE